jgi:sterol desaturase/sphingolipid hydroxylase (fatty acid hydroxylase superfamily)
MRDHLSWHYDHHMGDQDLNFGVAWSWFDVLAKTREIFVGTDKERANLPKHQVRAHTAATGAALRAQRRNPLRRLAARLARAT